MRRPRPFPAVSPDTWRERLASLTIRELRDRLAMLNREPLTTTRAAERAAIVRELATREATP